MQSKVPQSGRLPWPCEKTNMPEYGFDYHFGPFFKYTELCLRLWSTHLKYFDHPPKTEKIWKALYPKSGYNAAPVSGNRSIWAPFRYRQPPLWSKTPGVFAQTGCPEKTSDKTGSGHYKGRSRNPGLIPVISQGNLSGSVAVPYIPRSARSRCKGD